MDKSVILSCKLISIKKLRHSNGNSNGIGNSNDNIDINTNEYGNEIGFEEELGCEIEHG